MNQTEILTAPKTNESIPSGVGYKPFTVGAVIHKVMEKQSGVYKIQSKSNPERIYIGSTVNIKEKKGNGIQRKKLSKK